MRGITTVNIGGEPRILSLNNNFVLLLGVQLKCEPLNIQAKTIELCESNPLRALTAIIYCGLCAYKERTGNYEHGLSYAQVSEWVDDADQNEFQSVWDEFAQIMGIPKASEEQIAAYEEQLKKNLIQTTKPSRKSSKK